MQVQITRHDVTHAYLRDVAAQALVDAEERVEQALRALRAVPGHDAAQLAVRVARHSITAARADLR